MKRLIGLVVVVVILLVGGGLTAQLVANQDQPPVPVLRTTNNPEGAVQDVAPWQAEQFFLFVGFVIFNLVGIGATIAIIMWFADRGLRRSRAEAGIAPGGAKRGGRGRG